MKNTLKENIYYLILCVQQKLNFFIKVTILFKSIKFVP